jgi:hypothetical protein
MFSGVLKSGSPTPKDTTDSPASFIAFAFAEIASVSEGEIAEILFAVLCFMFFLRFVKFSNISILLLFFKESNYNHPLFTTFIEKFIYFYLFNLFIRLL